jgi:hypothetical protein
VLPEMVDCNRLKQPVTHLSLQETKGSTFLLLGIFLVAPGPVLKS